MLTIAGIVLGVGRVVGMHTAIRPCFAFSRTVDRIARKTELQVWARRDPEFDETPGKSPERVDRARGRCR